MLIYEYKIPSSYRKEFVEKIKKVSSNLKVNPNWLMALIDFETAGSFSPSITNSLGYVGLIQFGKAAAIDLGTTTDKLKKMSAVEQLDYVEKYFKFWYKVLKIEKPNTYIDTYLIVLFPSAVNKGDDFVIRSNSISASKFAVNNPAFDKDGNKIVTVRDVKEVMLKRLPTEWVNNGDFKLFVKAYKTPITILIGLGVIAIGGLAYYGYGKFAKK